MMITMKGIVVFFLLVLLAGLTPAGGQQSFEKEITGITWSHGDLGAEEHWMPVWLPVVPTGFRWKAGIKLSGGSLAVSCPMKVRMEYNQDDATGGRSMRFRVKATPQSSSQNTFDSSFGFSLPNKTQVGLISVPGLDNILPWFDTGIDLWDLFSIVPVVGSPVSAAVSNVGVNMRSTDALPLNGSCEYHDTRTLFSYDLTDLIKTDAKKANAVTRLFNKMSPEARSRVLTAIKVVKRCNDAEALGIFEGILGTAIEKVAGLGSVGIKGDPYFKVEGLKIVMVIKFNVGSRTSGTTVVTLTDPADYGEFFVSIPPFVAGGEQLNVIVDEISYEFKLSQTLNSQLAIPVIGDVDIVDYTKVITYSRAEKNLSDSEYRLSIPLQPSNLPIPEYIVNSGAVSAIYTYVSPSIPLKGVLEVKSGSRIIKTLEEQNFKTTHGLIVTGLTPSTTYSYHLSGYDAAGHLYSIPVVTKATKKEISTRALQEEVSGQAIHDLNSTAGMDNFTLTWNTGRSSSTEVYFSASAEEYLTHYLSGVKKTDNSVAVGWADAVNLPAKLETAHSIRITDLEPGTKYYYRVSSRFYKDNNVNNLVEFYVDKTGTVTTHTFPSVRVKAMDGTRGVASLPVELVKTGGSPASFAATTGINGVTPPFTLEAGASYQARLRNHPGFADAVSSTIQVSSTAQNELAPIVLNLGRKPSPGGRVVDQQGIGVAGATVKISGTQTKVTTGQDGKYNFTNVDYFTDKELIVTKSGFFENRGNGSFNTWGQFSALPIALRSSSVSGQIEVIADHAPLGNAGIKIKNSAGTVLKTGVTNSLGRYDLQHNFSADPPAGVYSVEITPPSGSKVLPALEYISLEPGMSYDYHIQCVSDHTAPVLSGIVIGQESGNLMASFVSSEAGTYQVVITKPDNTSATLPWSSFPAETTAVSNKVVLSNAVTGNYKIIIKVRDNYGNESASPEQTFSFFSSTALQLQAAEITATSAQLRWNQYPNSTDFGKYVLYKAGGETATSGTKVREFSSISMVSHLLSGLESGTTYHYLLKVFNKAGQDMGSFQNPAKVTFTTLSNPPVIGNVEITPSSPEVNQPVHLTATIDDADSKISGVTVIVSDGNQKNTVLNVKPLVQHYKLDVHYTPLLAKKYQVTILATDGSKEVAMEYYFEVSGSSTPEGQEGPSGQEEQVSPEEKAIQEESASPDVRIAGVVMPKTGEINTSVPIEVSFINSSSIAVPKATLFLEGPDGYTQKRVYSLKAGEKRMAKFAWYPKKKGDFQMTIRIEAAGDAVAANNEVTKRIIIQ